MDCEHCDSEAAFWVDERYLADDGVGAVERLESVCRDCVTDATPDGLENAYANYRFKIEPIPEAFDMTSLGD